MSTITKQTHANVQVLMRPVCCDCHWSHMAQNVSYCIYRLIDTERHAKLWGQTTDLSHFLLCRFGIELIEADLQPGRA